jgi:predicted RNA-binding Zn ribbon-like protein
VSRPAPDDLELLADFVNTREPDYDTDVVDTPALLHEWFTSRSLLTDEVGITADEHARAMEFREAIRSLGVAHGDGPVDPAATSTLNRLAAEIRLSFELGADGDARLRPVGSGLDEALGHLYSILYRAIIDGSFERLKACANESCRWVYLDRSKNRSKRWCDMQTCGNAANARAYRRRRRSAPDD